MYDLLYSSRHCSKLTHLATCEPIIADPRGILAEYGLHVMENIEFKFQNKIIILYYARQWGIRGLFKTVFLYAYDSPLGKSAHGCLINHNSRMWVLSTQNGYCHHSVFLGPLKFGTWMLTQEWALTQYYSNIIITRGTPLLRGMFHHFIKNAE